MTQNHYQKKKKSLFGITAELYIKYMKDIVLQNLKWKESRGEETQLSEL